MEMMSPWENKCHKKKQAKMEGCHKKDPMLGLQMNETKMWKGWRRIQDIKVLFPTVYSQ